jgi:hypothetical protein
LDIIPFGKYKGQHWETVKQTDKNYIDWLMCQDWFRDKFKNEYTIIVNNFNTQEAETPEHNQMQVRWLDDEYCDKFLNFALEKEAFNRKDGIYYTIQSIRTEGVFKGIYATDSKSFCHKKIQELTSGYRTKVIEDFINEKVENEGKVGDIYSVENHYKAKLFKTKKAIFEDNFVDVKLFISCIYEKKSVVSLNREILKEFKLENETLNVEYLNIFIELKPNVSDDFPAILRQMKKNKCEYLVCKSYSGIGATEEEFVKYFKTAGIKVVFEREFEEEKFINDYFDIQE